MASLENVYHDFPRLAKQSGFYFHLHRGRVNWTEIHNLVIEEITQNRNFQLLERNLHNVINCNLEREYDLKVLDQNFVKLFKLAQLGVDYLFYCEMYLDRCVILLQEQLTVLQKECESLKQENQKMKELNKSKRKNKTQNYQCEKCEKVFISEVYLKYHKKRRHSISITPENGERLPHKQSIDSSQQTEDERKLSASTQTIVFDEVKVATQIQDENSIKMSLVMKIENLEQELHDLKERLRKAENTLSENTETVKPNGFHSLSVHSNSTLTHLPSYLTQIRNEINPNDQISTPEVHQTNNFTLPTSVHLETTENVPLPENILQRNADLEKPFEIKYELAKEDTKPFTFEKSTKGFRDYQSEEKENLEYDKENIDPNIKPNIVRNLTKPLPPPRRSKKESRIKSHIENKIMEPLILTKTTDPEEKLGFNSDLLVSKSTPIKEKQKGETISEIFEESRENLREISTTMANSNDSLASQKSVSVEPESKSFIRKIVTKNSPKLQKLSRNIRKSLTNLYDTVFLTEKDFSKKDLNKQDLKAEMVVGLNNQLRRLGVDPEWSGIPKKTLKQKLNVLKHRRKLLSKENPTYPVIRQNIEEKVFQKLQKNLRKKKSVLIINKLRKQESLVNKSPTIQGSYEKLFQNKFEFVKTKNPAMYKVDTDPDSEISDSENNSYQDPEVLQQNVIVEDLINSGETEEVGNKKDEEFDLSVFQVGRRNLEDLNENRQKNVLVNKMDDVLTDLDFEGDFLKNLDDKSFTTIKEHFENKTEDEKACQIKNYDTRAEQFEFLKPGKPKAENAAILRDRNALQSKLTMTAKKRVLFANYPSNFEEEISDSPTDDDLWSYKSE